MAFMQIIEFRTSDIDRGRKINDEWWRATEGKRTVRRELLARDRSDPSRCFAVVFFDSYESAMENSDLPETKASAEQYRKMSMGRRYSTTWTSLRTGPRSAGHANPAQSRGAPAGRTPTHRADGRRYDRSGLDCCGYPCAPRPAVFQSRHARATLTTLLQQEGFIDAPADARRRHVPGRAAYR